MAGKSELSAAPNVQNVIVYVSNDNFAQAYSVGQQQQQQHNQHQQNVPPQANHHHHHHQQQQNAGGGYHTATTMLPKPYPDKQTTSSSTMPPSSAAQPPQGAYFGGGGGGFPPAVPPQPPQLVNQIYQNGTADNNSTNNSGNQRPVKVVRATGGVATTANNNDECDNNRDTYVDFGGYVTVMGAADMAHQQSVRCDSVRSETAESSCSSLSSSADEGLAVVAVQNQSAAAAADMVVYDSSVSVRPGGGAVLAVQSLNNTTNNNNTATGQLNNQPPSIVVPYGWKRLSNNGSVIYISPSNTALSSPEQVKDYLLTNGTCKCGLECHFKYDNVFNFDPKVVSKPWVLLPDTNTGDLTKLCNHKRKIIAMASLDCKPPDPNNIKLRKEYGIKRKKRKISLPYTTAGGQIIANRDKITLNQPVFGKELVGNPAQQFWTQNTQMTGNHLQGYSENQSNFIRCHDQAGNRVMAGSPMIVGDGGATTAMMVQQANSNNNATNISHQQQQQNQQISQLPPQNNPNIHIQQQQIIGPNGQIINVQGPMNPNNHNQIVNQIPNPANSVVIQGQTQHQQQQHRIFINNGQPNEPSGPGRPNVQMVPVSIANQRQEIQPHPQRLPLQQQFYNNSHPQYQQINHFDPGKNIGPFNLNMNGFRPQSIPQTNQLAQQQKMQWQNRMNMNQNNMMQQPQQQQQQQNQHNIFERVPPLQLHQHQPQQPIWQDDMKRKKVKLGKIVKNRPYHILDGSNCPPNHSPCPNIDVRQIQNDNSRAVIINQMPHTSQSASSPSFMEDPSGYLAQQTALLNNTINRQTGANGCTGYVCNSPMPQQQPPPSPQQQQQNLITVNNQPTNEVPLPSNMLISQMKQQPISNRSNQNLNMVKNQQQQQQVSLIMSQYNNVNVADSSAVINDQQQQQYQQCHGCIADSQYGGQKLTHSRPNSQPGTPSSSGISSLDDPVTSSTYSEKHQASPDTRPIQGGTVSTSNVSPIDGNQSPNPHTPTPPTQQQQQQRLPDTSQLFYQQQSPSSSVGYQNSKQECCSHTQQQNSMGRLTYSTGIVTTMASGRTVGSNTITSVLAGRANTATVSINSPSSLSGSSTPNSVNPSSTVQTQAITVNVSKSPLEMVQSVVSSIQVPNSQHTNIINTANAQQNSIVKHSPSGLPPGHILVSSGGQLIMASTGTNGQNGVMAPPPPKIISNQNSMPPISVSPMVTNVTAAVTQVIPAVAAQQVLGQQTVLVNALPAPFVLQPGVTMTMDGVTNMQIPQLVTGNVIQQQIQIDNSDHRRTAGSLLSPETKKKGKKRKMSQTVASMLQIAAAQQNSGMVQSFPQQIQMAHSPQGLTTGPVMQALTIVPSKTGGPPQIVMNGQTQQLITNSQPTQQINLLQPVNLINGTTGVVQNFPAIQQFIVPNLGGMVMNPDGTATLLQDTSNLGMQLQIQNVNGQNVLTPVQSNNVFNGGQSILAAGPAGMVIRAPNSQGKIIQQQQHSPGAAQFLSPTSGGQFVVNGTQFSGQLSPLVANVSPTQQVTFGTAAASQPQIRPNNSQQEFIQCGQTLMVPCTPATANIAVSSSNQNTTFVQQNTTIVQQQTTMVSNNQQIQNFQSNNAQNAAAAAAAASRTATTLNLDQNFIISSNDNKQMQAVVLQRDSPQNSNYRQSVSTQTAVNQNTQSVTTNTFCQTSTISAGSPPDTTTLSPMGPGGQSPPTADTTTHSGSTDDGLSPAPSNCSTNCEVQGRQSCSMAMVHCISSSEPDSAELCIQNSEIDWRRQQQQTPKPNEFTDITSAQIHFKKTSTPTHIALAESSTLVSGLPFFNDQMKQQESVVSSRNYDKIIQKRKNSDTLIVMESRQMHTSLFDDGDEEVVKAEQSFAIGNLVWGPMKSFPAWPGKIISIENDEQVRVKWFGNEKYVSKIDKKSLQTLSEGLDAHHLARKKCRTSRKLNTQLENAIQEAMIELDKQTEYEKNTLKPLKTSPKITTVSNGTKKSGRLRSSQR